jgi:excinuclease ABC subunit A
VAKGSRGKKVLFLLDEPTTGLHPFDIGSLLDSIQQLVDLGHTVVIIEHNLDVIKCADHVIDLGPEGGLDGGEILVTGSPEKIAHEATKNKSYTAKYLNNFLKQS